MPKAYSYIRFSTPEQARGDSLRRQVQKAEEWAAKRGMQIDESLREFGVSAHRGDHVEHGTVLGKFLEHVSSGRIEKGSYLIVESMDRLSREAVMEAFPRFIKILNAGIIIVTLSDNVIYSKESVDQNPYQLMLSLVPMIRSHEESSIKSIRVGEAWGKKREAARAGTHKMTRRTPEWISLEGDKFVLRDERVKIIRRIFRETIEGDGRRVIVNRLNLEREPTFRGHEREIKPTGWQTSSVAKILANKAVYGEFQPGTGSTKFGTHKPEGRPIKDYYPTIMDEETFLQAQNAIASRRFERSKDGVIISRGKGGRRGNGVAHLLIGLGKCGLCDGPIHLINKGQPPKGGLYFECSNARRHAGCDSSIRWRVDAIERRLLKHLAYIDADAVLRGEAPRGEVEAIEGLRALLADAQRRMTNRAAMLEAANNLDKDSLARHGKLAAKVAVLEAELAEAEKAFSLSSADPGLKVRLAEAVDLSRVMDEAEGNERTAIRVRLSQQLRQLIDRIVFHPEIGVTAILRARPDVPTDQIPFMYGATKKAPWLLSLDADSEPHGPAPWEGLDFESFGSDGIPGFALKRSGGQGQA